MFTCGRKANTASQSYFTKALWPWVNNKLCPQTLEGMVAPPQEKKKKKDITFKTFERKYKYSAIYIWQKKHFGLLLSFTK